MREVLMVVAVAAALAGCGGGSGGSSGAHPTTLEATTITTASSTIPLAAGETAGQSPSPAFRASVAKIPSAATLKYSWHSGCPVPVSKLRMISLTYWGMDDRPHIGHLVANATATTGLIKVFHKLYDNRYPIRQMKPVDAYKGSDYDSIEADNTSAFNCRNVAGSSSWSQHAYGLAIDVNPCDNPYVSAGGSIDNPPCRKYGDRSRHDPGMIHKGDATVRAFTAIGWGWGGSWSGAKDYQHFSSNGR